MTWSDLQPPVRAAILAAGALLVLILVWMFWVSPMRARQATIVTDMETAEGQLEQLERQIESIPPASAAEQAAWQRSSEELLSRLGPESELPLLLESLTRVADTQGLEVFITSGATQTVGAGDQRGRNAPGPSQSEQVLANIAGAAYVPLDIQAFGDYESIGLFLAQIGRLGWVTEFTSIQLARNFPEVESQIALNVYFRPGDGSDGTGSAGAAGALGGGR